jgi:hypothetical protein
MAPRSSAKTSAKSGASRDQASSPPKSSRERDTKSPLGRRTRLTRSQSVEQQEQKPSTMKAKRNGRAGSREGSVDSVGSNRDIASGRGGRAKQATRATAPSRGNNLVCHMTRLQLIDKQIYPLLRKIESQKRRRKKDLNTANACILQELRPKCQALLL